MTDPSRRDAIMWLLVWPGCGALLGAGAFAGTVRRLLPESSHAADVLTIACGAMGLLAGGMTPFLLPSTRGPTGRTRGGPGAAGEVVPSSQKP